MTNVRHLSTAEAIEREASEWIMRLQNEAAGPEDRQAFERWRAASPRHEQAYRELSALWGELRTTGRIARAVSLGRAVHEAGLAGESARGARRRRAGRIGLALAATVALAAVGISGWLRHQNPDTRFQTAIGEQASIELPDGSRLELNSNSLARVAYTSEARTIHLSRGEAFFEVAHQADRPFWVVAGGSWIRAVGTAFNVDLRVSDVRVTVTEGVVKVASSRASDEVPSDILLAKSAISVLNAGQQVEVKSGSAEIRPVPPLEQSRLEAWRRGMLHFDNQPLASVVEEANRYTPAQIRIEDPALAGLVVGGTFEANTQGVDALLLMLEEGFRLQVSREKGATFIRRAELK